MTVHYFRITERCGVLFCLHYGDLSIYQQHITHFSGLYLLLWNVRETRYFTHKKQSLSFSRENGTHNRNTCVCSHLRLFPKIVT